MANVFTKRVCLGDCGTHLTTGILCDRKECKEQVEKILAMALRSMRARTLRATPQAMRVPMLSAAFKHFLTERSPRVVA